MEKLKSAFKKNLPLLIFILFAVAFRMSFADQYIVPSGSMLPTIQIGDRILVNKMAYDFKLPFASTSLAKVGEPKRGDIIVFDNPIDGVTMVKRLIGLPGEHLVIDNGFVTINGSPIGGTSSGIDQLAHATSEDTILYREKFDGKEATIQRLPQRERLDHYDLTVPDNSYFAMGDNRDNSADSRVWGFVPREKLKGRAFAVFWSMRFDDNYIPHMKLDRSGQTLN
jgi:signal peptidase I